jgi:heparosan-N-sulfate-glucuronate 5-epimerase
VPRGGRALRLTKGVCVLASVWIVLIAALVVRQAHTIERFFESSRSGQVLEANIRGPVSGYYIDFSSRYRAIHTLDTYGVPLFVKDGHEYYHPVLISEFALGAYEQYLKTGDAAARLRFLVCADWLKDNLKRRGDFHYWEYTLPFRGARVPWVSGLAQGEGVSVLLRAYLATGGQQYLIAASRAIHPIFHDVSVGGSSIVRGSEHIFPQEYPDQRNRENVLNGAIAAYLGVHDYYRVTGDPDIERVDRTIQITLRDSLALFDAGYWSLYSQPPPALASPHYQLQHVRLLKILYSISGDRAFLDFAERFEGQARHSRNVVRYVVASDVARMRQLRFEDLPRVPERLWQLVSGRDM